MPNYPKSNSPGSSDPLPCPEDWGTGEQVGTLPAPLAQAPPLLTLLPLPLSSPPLHLPARRPKQLRGSKHSGSQACAPGLFPPPSYPQGSTTFSYFRWAEPGSSGRGFKWGKALPEFCFDEQWPIGGEWNGTHGLYPDIPEVRCSTLLGADKLLALPHLGGNSPVHVTACAVQVHLVCGCGCGCGCGWEGKGRCVGRCRCTCAGVRRWG